MHMTMLRSIRWQTGFCLCLTGTACHDGRGGAIASGQSHAQDVAPRVLLSPFAGRWYSANVEALRSEIDAFLGAVEISPIPAIRGLIVPHAGYMWSGATAAAAYRQVQGRSYRRVILLGPSHRARLSEQIALPDFTHLETPLGQIAVDLELVNRLSAYPEFITHPDAHRAEHSVQIQAPFLQVVLPEAQVTPLVVGQLSLASAARIAEHLRPELNKETLFVVSTDFTHYGPGFDYVPFRQDIPARIRQMDFEAFAHVQARDTEGFQAYIEKTGATICGRYPLTVLACLLEKEDDLRLLAYAQSGAMNNEYEQSSVSYLAAAWIGTAVTSQGEVNMNHKSGETQRIELELSETIRARLLALARAAALYHARHHRIPTAADLNYAPTPPTLSIRGAFVTLRHDGRLRGCIGEILPRRPLYEAVIHQAINAAFRDTRFMPCTLDELDHSDFEISALTPPRPVADYTQLDLGRHGIMLSKQGRSSVFLPQVPGEQGWDLPTTLTQLARKAGLPPDAWKSAAEFEVFEACVFGESPER